MLLPELQRMAQSMGITGTARMRKSQLVEAIQNRQGGQPAAPHATRRSAALDNSAQRVASAGADAPRHREQDDMEPDRTTQQGLGEGTYPAASGLEAPGSEPRKDAAGGGGADSQLAFEHSGTPGQATPGATGTAGPAGDEQRGDAQRGDAQDGDAQRADGHQGGDGQRGDRRRRNNGRRDDQPRGGEAAEQRQDQGGQRGGQAGQQDQGGRGDDDSDNRGGRRHPGPVPHRQPRGRRRRGGPRPADR